ncbi:MAG TPA: chorismate synthase [Rickettsiales bacterium]|nr:chorismate synthase [Rickettsiales bacterium]
MTGNTFGTLFKITTFGESHGVAVGCVIDGCPPNIEISEEDIQKELDKRKPAQSSITTQRKEDDIVQIMSGVFEGKTTGTPIMLLIMNKDYKSTDYSNIKDIFRPSHADYTYFKKYGIRDYRGGGRSSARETAARVAGGAIAKKFLKSKGINLLAFTQQIADIKVNFNSFNEISEELIESNIIRCPNSEKAKKMIELIEQVKNEGDSIGGIIQCFIKGCPVGLGEPVFDKLSAQLGKAMLSINAAKGFEFGEGFNCINFRGSTHNDEFVNENGIICTKTNRSGGIQGGISNGEEINFRVAFKPTATIFKEQDTINTKGENVKMTASGRHDPCVLPRAVPVVEAMTWLTLMDFYLLNLKNRNE